jgi:hypothetical protein
MVTVSITPANTTGIALVTTGSGWSPSVPAVGGTGNVVFSKATGLVGDSGVHSGMKVNATASGSTISNSAVAAATTADPDSSNNTATATTTVNTQADVSVTKTTRPIR